ncbi:T9SS type B sorting domain-containing protein [Flavobacteriaceae bacterium AH-315-B10]|nr:T9SS type B sorting domain-containing protein [Flavobacteriaceae bacterium AH-315-B10]
MKRLLFLLTILTTSYALSQNIQVDSQTYTPQQLIEDILINSDCITNVLVTNVVGGDFNNTDQSYGFFDATGTTFPFQSGLVLSTGRLINTQGPNTTLSDDDAPNWVGDSDLETILNEPNTLNATIIEFDFTTIADQVSFRYIFASEEYQENNSNTCEFSDLFGFLIRPINDTQYTNIALVPNTQTPVKVTTVHSGIPGSCPPINETYFGSWNGTVSPINFNGQTKVLTATATVIPNETYHVKLVIADEQNYRYDSAVFLEAGSFQLSTDIGVDRLLATNNPLCENETLELNAFLNSNNTYKWFKDSVELIGETNATYLVIEEGVYNVEVTFENNCVSFGEIIIEYDQDPIVFNTTLIECDIDQDGLTLFNLFNAEQDITNNNPNLISTFFNSLNDATQNLNEITNPTSFTSPPQIVYARIVNLNGCFSIAELTLDISTNTLTIPPFEVCDDEIVDGFSTFNLNDLRIQIEPNVPANASIIFYLTEEDAFNEVNAVNGNYINALPNSEVIYVKITNNNQCYALSPITLNVLFTPLLLPNEELFYCLNFFPQTITLTAGIINDLPRNYTYLWSTGETTSEIEVNQTGTYSVTVTYQNGCSSSREIIVLPSNIATIENIEVIDATINNTITVLVSGEGTYAFALDDINGPYQDSNVFENVPPRIHTVYVIDTKNNCGIVEEIVSVIGFPKFFTPNNDSYNDTWQIFGVSNQFQPNSTIFIYDRYGKLLKQLDPTSRGWDGTFNGLRLPSSDYWFHVRLQDGRIFKSHFTLKR